jgi:predicted RNA binding protein with dsRBD fold (UPF0201 family)
VQNATSTSDFTIPSIPVSKHALELLDKTKKLEVASNRYTKADSQGSSLTDLRRLLEDQKILESQTQELTKEIESVCTENFGIILPT